MNKIKQYWREILIGIFVLFSINKCTQSCNRQQKLNKANVQIEKLDSTIEILKNDTLYKAHQIDVLIEKINTANEKVNVATVKQEVSEAEADAAKARQAAAEAREIAEKIRKTTK